MVKAITVTPLRPSITTLPATNIGKKDRRCCLQLKTSDLTLSDVISECQSNACSQEAQATPLDTASALENHSTQTAGNQTKNAEKEELQCVADLKLYAAYLALESGAFLDHPWIKKLIDVSNRRLDPHELLKIYRENPGSLKIVDLKNPSQFWMPAEAGTTPLLSMSRFAAMRALVGKQNWKESPKLQAKWEQAAQKELPPNYPRAQDDLDCFYAYIAEKEKDLTAFLEGGRKDVQHQRIVEPVEA